MKTVTSHIGEPEYIECIVCCCPFSNVFNHIRINYQHQTKPTSPRVFESSVNSVIDDSTAPVSKKPKRTNPVIETILQEEATQPPVPDTDYELTIASPCTTTSGNLVS